MKTTPEALKALYQTLGGSSGNVAGESKTTGILNKIAALFGSTATADKIPDAIDNINAVASGVTKPDGKITITENATDISVAQYATADVNVSGGGSSDFSTAEVTLNLTLPEGLTADEEFLVTCLLPYPDINTAQPFVSNYVSAVNHKVNLPLYQGKAYFLMPAANANSQSYSISDPSAVALSGSVVYDEQMQMFYVTGDCTITATLVLAD